MLKRTSLDSIIKFARVKQRHTTAHKYVNTTKFYMVQHDIEVYRISLCEKLIRNKHILPLQTKQTLLQ